MDNLWERWDRAQKTLKLVALLHTTRVGRAAGEDQGPAELSKYKGKLVAFSTVSSRNNAFLRSVNFDAILVDEASTCTESDLWAMLRPTTRHLMLVGDHQQLSALSSHKGSQLQHQRSTMQRLVAAGYPTRLLAEQHRMVAPIGSKVSSTYYGGKLTNGEHCPATAVSQPMVLHDVTGTPRQQGTSWVNQVEASHCLVVADELYQELLCTIAHPRVVILSPYAAQNDMVATAIAGQALRHLVCMTIDSSQGREFDGVVVNTVRHAPHMGFWQNPSRLLVAVTRAKYAFRVVGHQASWDGWQMLQPNKPKVNEAS